MSLARAAAADMVPVAAPRPRHSFEFLPPNILTPVLTVQNFVHHSSRLLAALTQSEIQPKSFSPLAIF